MSHLQPLAFAIACCLSLTSLSCWAEDEISFNRDIRPILSDRCYFCHGFDENHRAADLRLDIREEAEYVWDVDSPENSELLLRITSDDPDMVMPPPSAHKKAITEDEVALIRRWIEQGAPYEAHWSFVAPEKVATKSTNPSDVIDELVEQKQKAHDLQFAASATPAKWLRRVSLDLTATPPTTDEMHAFETAVAEQGESAYSDAVDRLFASPAYGERMALEWLDVARYADTNGFQADAYRMNWPWRDWVIRAFNENMPYDQFTVEQLAGDLLPEPTEDQLIATAFNRNHMIQAEGGSISEENIAKNNFDRVETTGTAWMGLTINCCQCHDHKFDPLKQSDYYSMMSFFNQISETGMTSKKLNVKRPGKRYDIKYWVDKPFITVGSDEVKEQLAAAREEVKAVQAELDAKRDEYVAAARKWVQEIRDDPEEGAKRIKPGEYVARFIYNADLNNPNSNAFGQLINTYLGRNEPWKSMKGRIAEAEAKANRLQEQLPLVMVMRDDKPRETFVLLRGNYETPGDKVSPTTPEFLPPIDIADGRGKPNRLDFARWLMSPEHPLTSRVTVNRYWQLMFGRGLVATPDDFGLQGELPTHPKLLDWLSVDFRESGWDVQALVKAIALSKTYRQSAVVDAETIAKDPENKWLARGARQRLDSRILRDQALALSGLLNSEMGGLPVAPYQPGGIWESMSLNKNHYMRDDGNDLYRRSLYTVWRRVVAPANFFDVPSRQSCSVKVTRTSTPLHALTTLNDTTYVEAARVWAERLLETEGDQQRLTQAFFAATARQPNDDELQTLQQTLQRSRQHFESATEEAAELLENGEAPVTSDASPPEIAAWTSVCLLMLNLDETLCK
ncbi:PSD1 and planctomycete cytochrome C domain-containing protein [Rhodopirellula halodulae]|uniref:PSD1 and planctomycete cytochrome C domain-containing protein n=1 Tax=Rhodopirellula halodulae TaxID=2894198 RepID=UPI001E4AF74A|nr:PSD1 and planctomycete cytochrome C domain-containing protein [Rhodopirellula sp. JC737]MCC9655952.1 PSD1 and planctomycete cytochrome C domain-containing protein [Rhodopirellula sp. JC737]